MSPSVSLLVEVLAAKHNMSAPPEPELPLVTVAGRSIGLQILSHLVGEGHQFCW